MTSRRLAVSLILAALAAAGGALAVDRRAAAREAAAERRFPPQGQFVTAAGHRTHAVVTGQGPDVVLIHGAGGNLRDFTLDLTQRLAPRYRVIAMDRPGFGFSDAVPGAEDPRVQAAQLRAAADALGATRPIVVGHSYGGAVAMAWALAAPDRVRGVVSLAGATMPWPGGLDTWYHVTGGRIGGATLVPLLTALVPETRVARSLTAIFAPDPVPPGYGDHIGAGLTLRRATLRLNGRQVLALKDHLTAMSRDYASLPMPVEAIHGTADATVYADVHSVPLARRAPRGHVTLLPGTGHMPHHAHPAALEEALARIVAAT